MGEPDWQSYVRNSTDLKVAGINTYRKAILHFYRFGWQEGRHFPGVTDPPTLFRYENLPDWQSYITQIPPNTFNLQSFDSTLKYYFDMGHLLNIKFPGISDLDLDDYVTHYPDLQPIQSDQKKLIRHWIENGYIERRQMQFYHVLKFENGEILSDLSSLYQSNLIQPTVIILYRPWLETSNLSQSIIESLLHRFNLKFRWVESLINYRAYDSQPCLSAQKRLLNQLNLQSPLPADLRLTKDNYIVIHIPSDLKSNDTLLRPDNLLLFAKFLGEINPNLTIVLMGFRNQPRPITLNMYSWIKTYLPKAQKVIDLSSETPSSLTDSEWIQNLQVIHQAKSNLTLTQDQGFFNASLLATHHVAYMNNSSNLLSAKAFSNTYQVGNFHALRSHYQRSALRLSRISRPYKIALIINHQTAARALSQIFRTIPNLQFYIPVDCYTEETIAGVGAITQNTVRELRNLHDPLLDRINFYTDLNNIASPQLESFINYMNENFDLIITIPHIFLPPIQTHLLKRLQTKIYFLHWGVGTPTRQLFDIFPALRTPSPNCQLGFALSELQAHYEDTHSVSTYVTRLPLDALILPYNNQWSHRPKSINPSPLGMIVISRLRDQLTNPGSFLYFTEAEHLIKAHRINLCFHGHHKAPELLKNFPYKHKFDEPLTNVFSSYMNYDYFVYLLRETCVAQYSAVEAIFVGLPTFYFKGTLLEKIIGKDTWFACTNLNDMGRKIQKLPTLDPEFLQSQLALQRQFVTKNLAQNCQLEWIKLFKNFGDFTP